MGSLDLDRFVADGSFLCNFKNFQLDAKMVPSLLGSLEELFLSWNTSDPQEGEFWSS